MASNRVWNLEYVAGNPAMLKKIVSDSRNPVTRREALDGARVIERNSGGRWRCWGEHAERGERIYESPAEVEWKAGNELPK